MAPARPDVPPHRVVLLALLVAVLVLQPVLAAPAGDWPQGRADGGRTAYTPDATGPTGDVGPAWISGVDAVAPGTELTVARGQVYAGTHRGRTVAFDTETGQRRWATPVGDRVDGSPTAVADLVVVPTAVEDETSTTGVLVGLDADTGTERWRYSPDKGRPSSWFRGDPAVANGVVYVRGAFGGPDAPPEAQLFAVGPDGEGGVEERWRYELPDENESHVLVAHAVADRTVYAVHHPPGDPARSYVVALDAANGEERWRTPVTGAIEHVVVAEGAVFATGDSVTRLDAETGEVDVRLVSGSTRSLPSAYADGVLYVPADSDAQGTPDRVVAVDAGTGERHWTAEVGAGDRIEGGPTVSSQYVFVPTTRGEVVAIDRENGTVAWNHTVDSRLGLDEPVTPHGDTVYVAAGDLHALREGGQAVAGGFLGRVGGLLRQHAALGFAVVALGAGLTTGLVLGVLSLAGIHLAGLSRSPQRLLASRLFGVSTTYVRPWQRYVAHLLASVAVAVGVATVAMVGWLVLPVAAALFSGLLPALVPGLSLLSLPLALAAVTLVVGAFWAVLTYRWLPANQFGLDKPLAAVRRDWTLVHVGFGLALALTFPFVAFVFALVVFQVF